MANVTLSIGDMSMNGLNGCVALWTATDGIRTLSGATTWSLVNESPNVTNKRVEDDAKAKWEAVHGQVDIIQTWFGRSP